MSERLENFIFGFVSMALAAVLIFSVAFIAQAEQPDPTHQEVVTDSVEFHQVNVEAVAAAPDFYQMDVLQLASYDSTHEAAPAYLGIANHQKRTVPFPAVRIRPFMDGGNTISLKDFLIRYQALFEPSLLVC